MLAVLARTLIPPSIFQAFIADERQQLTVAREITRLRRAIKRYWSFSWNERKKERVYGGRKIDVPWRSEFFYTPALRGSEGVACCKVEECPVISPDFIRTALKLSWRRWMNPGSAGIRRGTCPPIRPSDSHSYRDPAITFMFLLQR